MIFVKLYKVLNKNSFSKGEYSIVPIRYEDRFKIMKWRNEQIYHLRQSKPLTREDQENYFANVVDSLFDKERPDQILFSYLKDGECIGYGGLVHINWIDKNAEISFIMKTAFEEKEFEKHWGIYLDLIEDVAFKELKLHKIYTYAFDLRPHLYEAVENKGFIKEATLKEHCLFEGNLIDVIIHSKWNDILSIRKIEESDKQITFEWANDPITRASSFNSEPIEFNQHSIWFDSKFKDETAHYFICKVGLKEAGLVRFDFDGSKNTFIIGITIAQKYRGRKLSTLFLKEACEYFLSTCNGQITAYIKEENVASVKAFERAGFKFKSNETIQGVKSLRYKYER